jgi:predicted enzyme related to lactoylglutathione lyase
LQRARLFYERTLELKLLRAGTAVAEYEVGSDRFHILVDPAETPDPATPGVLKKPFERSRHAAFEVKDFAGTMEHLKKHGCKFVAEPQELESGFAMAVIADPDGNLIMVQRSQPAKPAKRAKRVAKVKA